MPGDQILSLAPFLALARELAALLVPVRPRPAFRDALGASLVHAARQHYALDALEIAVPGGRRALPGPAADWRGPATGGRERRWVIGAAAVGSAVSAAGLVAYLWRQRSQRAA